MIESITTSSSYKVEENKKIEIKVKVGDGQLGWIVLAFKADNIIIDDGKNELEYDFGLGKDIKGKTIIVRSTVYDVNRNTNKTSVTYEFQGGTSDQEIITKGSVKNDNDPIVHQGEFTFI